MPDLSRLTKLTTLDLMGCKRVKEVSGLADLTELTVLNLSWCEGLIDLSGLSQLTELTSLDLSFCHGLATVPGLDRLTKLATLNLMECRRVKELPDLAELTRLTTLDLSWCEELVEVAGLAELTHLTSLKLTGCKGLTAVPGLGRLTELTSLDLSGCEGLTAVPGLDKLLILTSLDLGACTGLVALPGLGRLTELTSLRLSRCEGLTAVPGLDRLTKLTSLDLSSCPKLTTVPGLGRLTKLTSLDLSWCDELAEVPGLGRLTELTSLDLTFCRGLTAVPGLDRLTKLNTLGLSFCRRLEEVPFLGYLTKLTFLELQECYRLTAVPGLGHLTELTSLSLSGCSGLTTVPDLGKLTQLKYLDLSGCKQLTHLPGIDRLPKLNTLNLSGCAGLRAFGDLHLHRLRQLRNLYAFRNRFADLHTAVCGDSPNDNCLDAVKQYFAALGPDPKPDAEIKVFVLGNGQAGKTTLVRRLRDESWAAIKASGQGSTHGIDIKPFQVPESWGLPRPVTLSVWDFGGQDIYHGTHALFVQEPAVYVVVYSHDTDNGEEVPDDNGFIHRNRPLEYWFNYLRQEAGTYGVVHSPVLYVQTKCDRPSGDDTRPRYLPDDGFKNLSPLCSVSSQTGRGLVNFREKLGEAIRKLLDDHPQPPLPASWAAVRQEIREKQLAKTPRTLNKEEFGGLCETHGCKTNAAVLLAALHRMGVVFHRPGLFDGQVVVDQQWVLDAIYTVFTRKEEFQDEIDGKHGRFTRKQLERYFWKARRHSEADQRTFLRFMERCGICFRATPGYGPNYEGEYVLPDKLPPWGPDHELWFKRQLADRTGMEVTVTYTLLHDGIARTFLSRIGAVAGDKARYWRYGCRFDDGRTECEALVRTEGNVIRLQAWGKRAGELLDTLAWILRKVPCGQPPDIAPVERAHARPESPDVEDADLAGRLRPVVRSELELIAWTSQTPVVHLQMFYLVGCAFHAECDSFNSVAEQFKKRLDEGRKWPKSLPESARGISLILRTLGEKVFARYFGKKKVKLYKAVRKGLNAALTADGKRAWKATREVLARNKLLLKW